MNTAYLIYGLAIVLLAIFYIRLFQVRGDADD